jgi:uncharacterized membrane protein YecN with MAPEG domain
MSAAVTPLFPAVAAAACAALGLLAAFLAAQVIRARVRHAVNAGDGGHPDLAQAIRAHANLVEHAPLALLLLAFAEASGAWRGAIVALAVALLAARVASAWGLSRSLGPSGGRQAGAGLTLLVTVLASLLLLYRLLPAA